MSTTQVPTENERIQVVVRCRCMNEQEINRGYRSIIKFNKDIELEISNPKCEGKENCKNFEFDAVYNTDATQEMIYNDMVRPLVADVLKGFNATIFAYGQTGTGKTYTMEGSTCEFDRGIIPRVFDQIFSDISRSQNAHYMLRARYMQIYQDEIRDLLVMNSSRKLEIRENDNGPYVENLTTFVIESKEKLVQMFELGKSNRMTSITDMNVKSSRSHAIFTILVEMIGMKGSVLEGANWIGMLNLVDLAGSERQSKTKSEGTRLKEASKINLSLTALGNVISALQDRRANFIPYRDSKLTRLLKDSLGGNSKTLLIANIGPACYNYEESLNTLRFAARARNVKNKPRVNEDPVDTVLKLYQEQILALKSQIAQRNAAKKERLKEAAKSGKDEKEISFVSPSAYELDIDIPNGDGKACCETPKRRKLDSLRMEMEHLSNESLTESENEKRCIQKLTEAIETMERSMLHGSTDIIGRTNEQQKTLEEQAAEIRKRKQREHEMQQILEMQEVTADEIKGEFSNMQQEIELKSKKMKRINYKLYQLQNEIHDIVEEFNTERRDFEISHIDILQELKLALCIIHNFLPSGEKKRIFSSLFYDKESETWKVRQDTEPAEDLTKPQCSGYVRSQQPTHTATSGMEIDEQYRNKTRENHFTVFKEKEGREKEDVVDYDAVSPLRTTRDYESPKMSPVLKSIFDAALKGEEDIDVDAASVSSSNYSTRSKSGSIPRSLLAPPRLVSKVLLNSASSMVPPSSAPVYPKARGWVPK